MAHWPMPEPRRRGRCWNTSSAGWLRSPRMRRASGYPRLAPIAGVILLGAGGAGGQSERWLLTRFAEHDVAVEIALVRSLAGSTCLIKSNTTTRLIINVDVGSVHQSGNT